MLDFIKNIFKVKEIEPEIVKEVEPLDFYNDSLTVEEIIDIIKTSDVKQTKVYVNTDVQYNYIDRWYQIDDRYIDKLVESYEAISHDKEEDIGSRLWSDLEKYKWFLDMRYETRASIIDSISRNIEKDDIDV